MLTGTGSDTTALVQPIDNCKVPEDLDGPVWIWLTTDQQPLALNIHDRASDKILAGPTAAFIDSKSSALGALVRTNGAGFSSSETLAPSQTSSLLASATATPDGTTLTVPASAPTSSAATSTAVPAISVIGIGFIPA
ncbi:hypothetical protein CPB86DRAFT_876167 [Serendipita vermifera]|nr:hypothetical protein CPB86DRAFT_876167 [Serendipita vermifera]